MGASGTPWSSASGVAHPVAGQSRAGPKAASALLTQACPSEAGRGPDRSSHLGRWHQVASSVLASPRLCSAQGSGVPTQSAFGDRGRIPLCWHWTG